MSDELLELHLGDLVAIADGGPLQGERGRVVALEGDTTSKPPLRVVETPVRDPLAAVGVPRRAAR